MLSKMFSKNQSRYLYLSREKLRELTFDQGYISEVGESVEIRLFKLI